MKTILSLNAICFFLLSCNQGNKYNGRISVENSEGATITEFKNGVKEGAMVTYFTNGMTRDSLTYTNDKQNGRIFHYDSLGALKSEEFAYFGLKVGPRVEYQQGKMFKYSFIDFNRTILFECKYDTGGKCRYISSFVINPVITDAWLRDQPVKDFSTYLPRPPKFTTTYKLGITYANDKNYELSEIRSNDVYWDTILPILPQGRNYYISCHLYNLKDSINKLFIENMRDTTQ